MNIFMNKKLALVAGCIVSFNLFAATELPNPTALQDVLSFQHKHQQIEVNKKEIDIINLTADTIKSENDLSVNLFTQSKLFEQAEMAGNINNPENSAILSFDKKLWDFGKNDSKINQLLSSIERKKIENQIINEKHKIELIETFYKAVLSDLEFIWANEKMAIAFIRADRAKQRMELGEVNEVDYLKLETVNQEARNLRFRAQQKQKATRTKLANLLGIPDMPPNDIVKPRVDIPEKLEQRTLEELWIEAKNNNHDILLKKQDIIIENDKIQATLNEYNPTLSGNVRGYWTNNDTSTSHPLSTGLSLNIPLHQGNKTQSKVNLIKANIEKIEADIKVIETELLNSLIDLQEKQAQLFYDYQEWKSKENYREVYLDKSRAKYELEIASDLGDAMTESSKVKLEKTKIELEWDLVKRKIQFLTNTQESNK